jgi:hypothetical protein
MKIYMKDLNKKKNKIKNWLIKLYRNIQEKLKMFIKYIKIEYKRIWNIMNSY